MRLESWGGFELCRLYIFPSQEPRECSEGKHGGYTLEAEGSGCAQREVSCPEVRKDEVLAQWEGGNGGAGTCSSWKVKSAGLVR